MSHDYWNDRWTRGETRWDAGRVNPLLLTHGARIGKAKRVLVPLAGKSEDLKFLAAQGHDVVGVEFVQSAIDAFFAGRKATPHKLGAHDAWYADGVTLVRSDIFAITPASIGRFEVIYDRAALVALPPEKHSDYLRTCGAVCSGGTFLISYDYPPHERQPPPYSVDEDAVRNLYTGRTVTKLEAIPSEITETAYWIGA